MTVRLEDVKQHCMIAAQIQQLPKDPDQPAATLMQADFSLSSFFFIDVGFALMLF